MTQEVKDVLTPDELVYQGYTEVPYAFLDTLEEKIDALLDDKILMISRNLDRSATLAEDFILVKMVNNIIKISMESTFQRPSVFNREPYNWITYDLGINHLNISPCLMYQGDVVTLGNKFFRGDAVRYNRLQQGDLTFSEDVATVLEVFQVTVDGIKTFAYRLSGDSFYYKENFLRKL